MPRQKQNNTSQASRRALVYCRVPTDEQAKGYSLSDQAELITRHARRHGIEVVATFTDDASARTRPALGESFKRPGFQKLLAWAKQYPRQADLLLFKDWSRFSRDATDTLVMIRQLDGLGIECQAVEQPIDWSIPEQVPMLLLYVGLPMAENRRRALNIRRGIRAAQRSGRHVNAAPIGYVKRYDEHGRVYIEPDAIRAPLVEEAFRLVATTEMTLDAVRRKICGKAYSLGVAFYASRYRFGQMLRNRVYLGQVHVSAFGEEPEEWIEATHVAIIDRVMFDRVERRISKSPSGRKYLLRDELPLRGHLLCPRTGALLTGSASRSRHGYRVWYYHGQGKIGRASCRERV